MMGINRNFVCYVVLLTYCVLFPAASVAEEPEIARLKQAIPVLSPENEALNSFYLIGESVIPLGVPVTFEACWTRDRGFGFVQNDQLGYPIFFIAEKKMLLYDATQSQVLLDEKVYPQALIFNKDRKLTWNTGFGGKEKTRFFVDVASLVSSEKQEPKLSRINETDWKLTYTFERQTEVIYVFRVDQKIAFKSALFKSGKQILFTVRNVAINQPVPERLMKFPDIRSLPAEINVKEETIVPDDDFGKAVSEVTEGAFSLGRALCATAAMENEQFRKYPFFSNINWEQAKQKHKLLGPKLKTFLKVDIQNLVIQPKQAGN
ncbi:hypothetical protein [Gimesia chilikensis]|uniref:hypothetical protein n=1 Tax=Gimesia chilikensis TaxID=2605989 RepID=UPI00118B099C|nr:hypothetical protein [Gimesia chilikensis]QDT84069.1 hypothetical protein MalM14_17210 [Gimesia chilikensis]